MSSLRTSGLGSFFGFGPGGRAPDRGLPSSLGSALRDARSALRSNDRGGFTPQGFSGGSVFSRGDLQGRFPEANFTAQAQPGDPRSASILGFGAVDPFTGAVVPAGFRNQQTGFDALRGLVDEERRLGDSLGDLQRERLNEPIQAIADETERTVGQLQRLAATEPSRIRGQGREMFDFVERRVRQDDATLSNEQAQTAMAINLAETSRMQSDMARVRSGMRADGTLMTSAEQSAEMERLNFQAAQASDRALAGAAQGFQNALAQTRAAGTATIQRAAEFFQGTNQAAAQLEASLNNQALQAQFGGQDRLFQFIAANPIQRRSRLNAIMNMFNIASAPGATGALDQAFGITPVRAQGPGTGAAPRLSDVRRGLGF